MGTSNYDDIKQRREDEEIIRTKELNDIKSVLAHAHGRRWLWKILAHCKTFESIWEPSAKIHYNSGRQDVGHFLMAEVSEADENLLFKMMKEGKTREMEDLNANKK